MKKMILCLACLAMLLPSVSFAAEGTFPDDITLSNDVYGAYATDVATDATAYTLSTAHRQGNIIYGSSSVDSAIYFLKDDTGPLTSGDLWKSYKAGGFVSTPGTYVPIGS